MLSAGQRKEHVLNRIGYGPGLWASNHYDQVGQVGYVNEQINGVQPAISETDVFIEPKIIRSVTERRQLECVLLDFWFNHFNVNASSDNPNGRNNPIGRGLHEYQNTVIGPHILGVFSDMLMATAKSAPMLKYLDNNLNRKPQVLSNGVTVGYNQNYAREVMELHTLSIDGGYDETDVQEVTRILTGWGYTGINADPPETFIYRNGRHDDDAKTVMNVDYPAGGGLAEGEALLDFLATHPSTADFVAYKLCARFVGDSPPASVLAAASGAFNATGGNLKVVANLLFNDAAFLQPEFTNFRSKVKPPHRYVASALMAMGASVASQWADISVALRNLIIAASDTPYYFAPPTGYPEAAGYWMSTASMLVRFEIAELIAYNNLLVNRLEARSGADGSDIASAYAAIESVFLPGGASADTEAAVKDHAAANAMTNRQRISAIAHMLLCSPEFMRY